MKQAGPGTPHPPAGYTTAADGWPGLLPGSPDSAQTLCQQGTRTQLAAPPPYGVRAPSAWRRSVDTLW